MKGRYLGSSDKDILGLVRQLCGVGSWHLYIGLRERSWLNEVYKGRTPVYSTITEILMLKYFAEFAYLLVTPRTLLSPQYVQDRQNDVYL